MIKSTSAMGRLLLLVSIALLNGCVLIPGSHYSTSSGWFNENDDDDQVPELDDEVVTYPINASVLMQPADDGDQKIQLPDALSKEAPNYDYIVGPGDVLQITVWDHPELTIPAGSMRSSAESGNWVHNDGTIFYPYVGKIKVQGLKVTDIRDLISKQLAEYIEDPQVDVTIAAFRSQHVYVTGAVETPGVFPVTNTPTRLIDAINEAGGLEDTADWNAVTLTREGKDYTLSLRSIYQKGKLQDNILLKAGDVINVPRLEDSRVFVLGEVVEPQKVAMARNGLTLAEALSTAGGVNEKTANASGIFVMRKAPEGSKHLIDVYQLNAKSAVALVLADGFELRRGDIVYVTAAPIIRWNRVVNNLVPTAQAIFFGSRARNELDVTGIY